MPASREHRHTPDVPAGPARVRREQPGAPALPPGGTATGLSPEQLLVLQRTAGNGAVSRSLERQQGHTHGHDHHGHGHAGGSPAGRDHEQPASPALTAGLPVQRLFKRGGRSQTSGAPPAAPEPEPPPSVAVHPHDDPKRHPDSNVRDPLAGGVEAYLDKVKKAKKEEESKRIRDEHARVFEGFLRNTRKEPLEEGIALRRSYLGKHTSLLSSSARVSVNQQIRGEVEALETELRRRKAADRSQKMVAGETEERLLQALRSGGDAAQELPPEEKRVYDALSGRAVDWSGLQDAPAKALILVERRGLEVHEREEKAAGERLEKLRWFAPYKEAGLELRDLLTRTHDHLMRNSLLTSNLALGNPADPSSTIHKLTRGPDETFKNFWETDSSSGQPNRAMRGSREEHLGYKEALNRTAGDFQNPTPDAARDKFSPPDPSLLPKYASLISAKRPRGLTDYGEATVHWKPALRDRCTLTPIDSWQNGVGGARGVTGSRNLYPLLAHGPEVLVRLAVAEATDFRYDREMEGDVNSGKVHELREYFEAHLHGLVKWTDVERIKLVGSPWATAQQARLEQFAQQHGLSFRVETA
ncbi:hypothetical protein [Streptomyces lycii]|uniref:Uncharacterized protein n=1 Tax=Streptomyces lycii TaxID=2654337 RepID=A0ABQ7FPJ5_9ACTN|nr:hypothetical protein [Streptomyces lycii]KAF4409918.1 hypothetical protein GCU69_06545 [Streptomyces lycii]